MVKVIKYGIAICIIVLIGDWLLSFGLSKVFERNIHGQSGGDLNYYLNYAPKADFLIVGNSRAYRHFDPDSLSDNGYNLSHNGMHLPFHAGVVSLLDNWDKMPDTLLLQVEPSSFVFFIEDDIDTEEVSYLNNYYNKSDYIRREINGISKFENLKYLFSTYQYNGKLPGLLKSLLSSQESNVARNGFAPLELKLQDTIRLNRQLVKFESVNDEVVDLIKKHKIKKSTKAMQILSHVQSLCNNNNTQLIIVVSPNYTVPNLPIQEANKYISTCTEDDKTIYFNYIEDRLLQLNDKKYWRDFEHLNAEGAKLLSSDLRRKIGLN